MSLSLAFDPLFRLPLATGLLLALALPLLGAGLRLREQWLSGLGVAQAAAAGAVAGALLHGPLVLFALLGALLAGLVRFLTGTTRNEHYAVMLLGGWAAVLLLATLGHHADLVAMQLLNGQLYFTTGVHLGGAAVLVLAVLATGAWLGRRLLLARLFPDHYSANQLPTWPHEIGFEVLVAVGVVLGIGTMGVMATFAMMMIPPWVAFRLARGWRPALLLATALGVAAFLAGFLLALELDLPFGPALVAVLLLLLPLRLLPYRVGG
ncbi:metal ABC transporter permease [Wenzhouxiangella sp. XN24]|uniref:metal ABC transporter permease n=1 Tax=Wenzhouxiangella sp. XN24 TaxID=2713569 RepID=UPI0013E9F669|nr:metal ABC transporter permease [Wenzhouxiangella sp. XN24]NGX14748.1 ABC transporter [Wenzhouxiangella sp. XN24]